MRSGVLHFLKTILTGSIRFKSAPRLLGRYSAGEGAGQEIKIGAGLTLTGDTLHADTSWVSQNQLSGVIDYWTSRIDNKRDHLAVPLAPTLGFTAVNFDSTEVIYGNLTGNSTITFLNLAAGKVVDVLVLQTGMSGFGINWPAGVMWRPAAPSNPVPTAPVFIRFIATTSAASGVIGLVLTA